MYKAFSDNNPWILTFPHAVKLSGATPSIKFYRLVEVTVIELTVTWWTRCQAANSHYGPHGIERKLTAEMGFCKKMGVANGLGKVEIAPGDTVYG